MLKKSLNHMCKIGLTEGVFMEGKIVLRKEGVFCEREE
jgi:hypothetical protein